MFCFGIILDLQKSSRNISGIPAYPPPSFLSGSQSQGHCLPEITEGSGTEQLGTTLTAQRLLKLFKLSDPKPTQFVYPPSPFLPVKTTITAVVHVLPSPVLPRDWPWCCPTWPWVVWWAPSSWELWVTSYLFSWSVGLTIPEKF